MILAAALRKKETGGEFIVSCNYNLTVCMNVWDARKIMYVVDTTEYTVIIRIHTTTVARNIH